MLFNSFEFAAFFAIVFLAYWLFVEKVRIQNAIIIVASYFFYGCWDWRFLALIVVSSASDFLIAKAIDQSNNETVRWRLLCGSLVLNLGILGFFKYFNFFIDSLQGLAASIGVPEWSTGTLNILLPVGISFYTFQTLSYTIDVYRRKISASNDVIAFFAFVSFFPQLVAGPIERASNLLPQFEKRRQFDDARSRDGLRQILWGLAKKLLIADNCGQVANDVFANHLEYSSLFLIIGAVCFAFQIYGDFSGYSDVAIGTARLFGFDLMQNFRYPYFSRDIAEFWRRWHISLSTWFRDYVYIAMGGSRVTSAAIKIRNVFVVFLLSGLWHGANWTFVFWGLVNALLFVPLLLSGTNRRYSEESSKPQLRDGLRIATTFALVCLAWIFFRAETIPDALSYIHRIFVNDDYFRFSRPGALAIGWRMLSIYVGSFLLIEWFQRQKKHGLEIQNLPVPFRWCSYLLLSGLVFNGILGGSEEFIYFQF